MTSDSSPAALVVCRKRLLDTGMVLSAPTGCPGASLEAEFIPGIAYSDIRLTAYRPGPGKEIGGLDAVDQWSVGFYDRGVFRAQSDAARRRQSPELAEMLQLPQLRGTPAILIVDIYGNRSVWLQED